MKFFIAAKPLPSGQGDDDMANQGSGLKRPLSREMNYGIEKKTVEPSHAQGSRIPPSPLLGCMYYRLSQVK